jgi:hypothetical protein
MVGITTILDVHLPTTSMGSLHLHTACSPVRGSITFLLGTSLPSSMGVVHFPLALVSFPVHLYQLPQATVFWACPCALLSHMRNFNHPLVWMPPDLSLALGTDHLSSLQSLLLHLVLLPRHLTQQRSLSLDLSWMPRSTLTRGIIKFYLHEPEFSTSCADGKLTMTASNLKARRIWEGQLCLAVKDWTLRFHFKNKVDTYNGCGFEMLATLNTFCCPDSVANTFSSLLLIFNKLQGDDEPIVAFCSQFNGLVLEMAHCKVVIPPSSCRALLACPSQPSFRHCGAIHNSTQVL